MRPRAQFVNTKKEINDMGLQDDAISEVSESLANSSDLSVVDSENEHSELSQLKAQLEVMHSQFHFENDGGFIDFTKFKKDTLK